MRSRGVTHPSDAPAGSRSQERPRSVDDPDAVLFRKLYPGLRRFAAAAGPLHADPDDLVQQAVANALSSRSLIEYEHPGAYLRMTIINLLRSSGRRARWHSDAVVGDAHGSTSDAYPSDLQLLEHLTTSQRAAVYLVDIEQCTHAEAASILGIAEGSVTMRLRRARQVLRDQLQRTET